MGLGEVGGDKWRIGLPDGSTVQGIAVTGLGLTTTSATGTGLAIVAA